MRIGNWQDIVNNEKKIWLTVLVALVILLLTMPIWGWHLEEWLTS